MNRRHRANTVPHDGSRRRLILLAACVLALFGVVLTRAVHLQILQAPGLRARADDQRLRRIHLQPARGTIYDRNRRELARTVAGFSIFVDPSEVLPSKGSVKALCEVLGLDARATRKRFATRGARFTWLTRGVSPKKAKAVRALDLPGVGVIREPQRFYPKRSLAGQVLGVVGVDGRGLGGIEYKFDEILKGHERDVVAERDARGRLILAASPDPTLGAGGSLVLTVDETIQSIAEDELARAVEKSRARGGIAIAIDPATGEVLAMAHNPPFNPNDLAASSPERRKVGAVVDVFEPGSTMKGLFLGVLLDRALTRPGEKVFCENGTWPVLDRVIHDHVPHGWLTVADVLQVSSNIGMAKLAERTPVEVLYEGLGAFGFGRFTGIELGGESRGIFRDPSTWSKMTPLTVAYGQGISATALQVVSAYGAIANGGVRMKPHLVRRVLDAKDRIVRSVEPESLGRAVTEATAGTLLRLLERVVSEDGTAPLAMIPGYSVAGKTGTAWKPDPKNGGYRRDKVVASFVGIVPAEKPRLVLLVAVDEPTRGSRYGGMVAAPAFRKMAQRMLSFLQVPPDRENDNELPALPVAVRSRRNRETTPTGTMPDVFGMTMREVLETVAEAGIETRLSLLGSGIAGSQDPGPGAPLSTGQACSVVFKPLF